MLKVDTIKKWNKRGWILRKPLEFKVFKTDSGTILECKKPRMTLLVNSTSEKDYLKAINRELLSMVKAKELDTDFLGKEVLIRE